MFYSSTAAQELKTRLGNNRACLICGMCHTTSSLGFRHRGQ